MLRSMQRQAARESGLPYDCIQTVLRKKPKWHAWKPHLSQALSFNKIDICMKTMKIMLAWYEDWTDLTTLSFGEIKIMLAWYKDWPDLCILRSYEDVG